MTSSHHLPRLTLVLGGARSGKSRYAEELITGAAPPWVYLATAEALDDEMRERIAQHRHRRNAQWLTTDAPRDLAGAIAKADGEGRPILIDCLTLWLSNTLLAGADVEKACEDLAVVLEKARGPVVAVSNEVGFGLVPETPLGRRFRDAQGRLNQQVAAIADRVVLVAAGLPLTLK
ncbi:adenosylcobinamide kinase [Hyphomicrobium nitrativorans NL23]|uniref:Bifunctional adenosylcobalamin biosynthesis protein n=1 Tax=Hyphomicrobium nitrativorans NL23 TaxID=1029756 RepID=V5SD74_9HYPH|nr:bifunctional adenosylcobinamide kinase/adenosylcobinamide-phosphate guanylyltransferase [Hyphomicrobium nitrativorans]AHB48483.1 adenosylcobinamide kinase [Hyphomicrobium nitrativorans NL23]